MITCKTCPRCKDTYPNKLDRDGNKFYICGMSGNMVYKEPRKVKKACGYGYIHYSVSSCGLYDTVDDVLKDMTTSEKERYWNSQNIETRQLSIDFKSKGGEINETIET